MHPRLLRPKCAWSRKQHSPLVWLYKTVASRSVSTFTINYHPTSSDLNSYPTNFTPRRTHIPNYHIPTSSITTATMRNALLLAVPCLSTLAIGQTVRDQQYIDSVCSPSVNVTAGSTIPPCISVKNIQQKCEPNGTQPQDLAAHAQCLCNKPSSFFVDWLGCSNCMYAHGGITGGEMIAYDRILMWASSSLCSGLKTAKFDDIFSSLEPQMKTYATDDTGISDSFPSSTAASLYYTADSVQGPGVITGILTEQE